MRKAGSFIRPKGGGDEKENTSDKAMKSRSDAAKKAEKAKQEAAKKTAEGGE